MKSNEDAFTFTGTREQEIKYNPVQFQIEVTNKEGRTSYFAMRDLLNVARIWELRRSLTMANAELSVFENELGVKGVSKL